MTFQKEKQIISADQLLQVLAHGDDIRLNQCTVTGALDINRLFDSAEIFSTEELTLKQEQNVKTLELSQALIFDRCTFEEDVVFSEPWSGHNNVVVKFTTDVIFNSSIFKRQTRFKNAVFSGIAGFDGCTFNGMTTFKNASFRQDAKFRTSVFKGYGLFGKTKFHSSARLTNTHFARGVNFSETQFLGQTDFNGVYSSSRAVPAIDGVFFARHKYGEDESFWRFIKQSAQEAGYYQLAGECFYKERCGCLWQKFHIFSHDNPSKLRIFIELILGLRLLPELIFGRWLFGYGERPVRVLVASLLVIVTCAFFYSQPGVLCGREGQTDSSFMQGLYFSIVTFTTVGYGDLFPSTDGFSRYVAMAQAITGGGLMALFIVSLAKRFSRS